jgi:hypothetical protein
MTGLEMGNVKNRKKMFVKVAFRPDDKRPNLLPLGNGNNKGHSNPNGAYGISISKYKPWPNLFKNKLFKPGKAPKQYVESIDSLKKVLTFSFSSCKKF